MAVGLVPICLSCNRWRGLTPGIGYTCDAFPDYSIPVDILASKANHRKPYPGDRGIRYEPRSLDVAEDIAVPSRNLAMKPMKVMESGHLPSPGILKASQKRRHHSPVIDNMTLSVHDALTRALGMDPPVSEAQRRLMWAKATGHGKSDVPTSVAKEFTSSDPGGKLPEKAPAKDLAPSSFKVLRWLLDKFFQEEAAESEHAEPDVSRETSRDQLAARDPEAHKLGWSKEGGTVGVKARDEYEPGLAAMGNQPVTRIVPGDLEEGERIYGPMWGCWDAPAEKRGAGVMFVAEDGRALFLKRSKAGDHAGEWAFPGGRAEGDENQLQTARREATEETGHTCPICGVECAADNMRIVDHSRSHDGTHFTTFGHYVRDAFEPRINAEHTEAKWAPLDKPPEPLHPAVAATLQKALDLAIGGAGKGGKLGNQSGFDDGKDRLVFEPSDVYGRRFASDQRLAMDRAATRSYDESGRLHVDEANISKATVNPYTGDEINAAQKDKPGWKPLDPEKKFLLLRHPDEIEKAAPTLNGVPLLFIHKPTSADDHPYEITVGAVGDNAKFEYPHLKNSLTIWPREAISAVENGDKQQLSAGYSYDLDMTPGVFEGMKYDGVMRNLHFNHVSLVNQGRAGPDVMIGDEDPFNQWETIAAALRSLNSERIAA